MCGLGEKSITINKFADGQEIHDELLFGFPKLQKGGGYELLRIVDSATKELDIITAPAGGYSVEYLKAVTGSAKIFVRPLQTELDMEAAEDPEVGCCIYIIIIISYSRVVTPPLLKRNFALKRGGA